MPGTEAGRTHKLKWPQMERPQGRGMRPSRSLPAALALLLLTAPALASGGDCGSGGDADASGSPLVITSPIRCGGELPLGDTYDTYAFTAPANAPVRLDVRGNDEFIVSIKGPSWTSVKTFSFDKGVILETDATAGDWWVEISRIGTHPASYTLGLSTQRQTQSGHVMAGYYGTFFGVSLAEGSGPGGRWDGFDGKWLQLATTATGEEWLEVKFPGGLERDLDARFYNAALQPVGAPCATPMVNVHEACEPPAGARWVLVTAASGLDTPFTLLYHH